MNIRFYINKYSATFSVYLASGQKSRAVYC